MAYSTVEDLLLGNIPLSQSFSREKFITDAADEIDSWLGPLYVTPFNMAESSPIKRHSRLLIKRISNFLATGRMILALDAGGEDTNLHSYGARLVKEAQEALQQLKDGQIHLDGAPTPDGSLSADSGPTIKNADKASAVDAFYARVMAPDGAFPLPYRDWAPGSNPNGVGIP